LEFGDWVGRDGGQPKLSGTVIEDKEVAELEELLESVGGRPKEMGCNSTRLDDFPLRLEL